MLYYPVGPECVYMHSYIIVLIVPYFHILLTSLIGGCGLGVWSDLFVESYCDVLVQGERDWLEKRRALVILP